MICDFKFPVRKSKCLESDSAHTVITECGANEQTINRSRVHQKNTAIIGSPLTKKKMLSDSESSEDDGLHELIINDHYAKAFEYKKEREELQKR